MNDIRFEEASILYNIGAMYSRLAANETRRTPEVNDRTTVIEHRNFLLSFRVRKQRVPISDTQLGVSKKSEINT